MAVARQRAEILLHDGAVDGFTKRRPGANEGFFAVEAAGLSWLAVAGGVPVARPLAVTATSITVQRVPGATPTARDAEIFGRRLVVTHDAGAPAFGAGPPGWVGDGFIGDAPLSLRPGATWGRFYAEQRVLPYAFQAHADGALTRAELVTIERLADRLSDGHFDDGTPPARIHGDLWSGNVLHSPAGVVLIDPAAHGGHRITDLAMLALFGAPHLGATLKAYETGSAHLPPGWRDLIPLHQIHPLLVHATLFGGSYGSRATAAARRYL